MMFRVAMSFSVLALCGVAGAATWTVDDDGPADFDNIQAAINASSDGDEIVVEPGTYTGTGVQVVNMIGKAITLRASATPEETIIDGEEVEWAMQCISGETAGTVIEGLTFIGGSGNGGIACWYSSPTLTNCVIKDSTDDDDDYGVGIYCYSSNPTITGCTIWNNSAGDHGDIGGGIWCDISSPTLTDCTILGNTGDHGGGISCIDNSSPTLTNCVIKGNTAASGGGIYCSDNSSSTLIGCTILGNTATYGGGIYCNSSNHTLTGCTISNNTADFGGGISSSGSSDLTLTNCEISGNTASDEGGGVICYSSNLTLTNCVIKDNTGDDGGGIYCNSSNPTLTDTSVCCNTPNQITGTWTDNGGNDVADECIDDCNCNDVSDIDDVADGTSLDCDQDLVPDECEPDCDGDGIIDDCDSEPDQDGNGVPDNCDPDCNENGIADGIEILFGWVDDCDGDVVPDDCQLADGSATDCDFDGALDHCQIADDPDLDCDVNGVLDSCEVEPVLTQAAKLTADDGALHDNFGCSVATADGVAVIGAYYDNDGSGSAYVYEQQGDGTWEQFTKLTADDGASYDYFGLSVALDAGVAVIGAFGDADNGFSSGSAYVFEQQGDGTWQQTAKLTADDGASADEFGRSVALDAGVVVIGAYEDDNSGSAYVFEQQGDGTWQQTAKLTADDGASFDRFGFRVATSGGVAVIGAFGDDDNTYNTGSAYVYEQQADGTWQQTAKLTADDWAIDEEFGYSVATSGGVAVIGAPAPGAPGSNTGSAYVFEQQGDGTWQQTAKLTAVDGASADEFGFSVALDAGVVVIGAYQDDNSGSAYVFEQQGDGTWQQTAKLTANDGASMDNFGCSVATADGVAVIGAYGDDDNGSNSGSAYVFEPFSQADCDANGLMDDCEIEEDPSLDCDLDGVLDSCAVADGSVDDCNENGIPDSCDIANGGDADGDGYLDECECSADIAGPDGPGFPDGIVGTDDLLTVIGYWGSSIPNGDINNDGIVGTDDLLAVIGDWGKCE